MELNTEEKKKKLKSKKVFSNEGKDQFRVVISLEANTSLERLLKKVNDGFQAGAITKSDIANYLFENVDRLFQESDVNNLRAAHFDEKKVLSSILRTDADLPEELKKVIRAQYGINNEKGKKRTNRAIEFSTVSAVENSKVLSNSV